MARSIAYRACSEAELTFAAEFVKTGDGAAAARVAWPSHKHPRLYAVKVLKRPHVLEEIERHRKRISAKLDISVERTMAELAKAAYGNLSDLLDVQEDGSAVLNLKRLDDKTKAALAEYTVDEYAEGRGDDKREVRKHKVKFHDKLKALELLGKAQGMFAADAININVKNEVTVVERLQAARNWKKPDVIDVKPESVNHDEPK